MEIDSDYSDLEDYSSEYEPENSPAPKAKVSRVDVQAMQQLLCCEVVHTWQLHSVGGCSCGHTFDTSTCVLAVCCVVLCCAVFM